MEELKNITKMVEAILQQTDFDGLERLFSRPYTEVEQEIEFLFEHREKLGEVAERLFPGGVSVDAEFYHRLSQIPICLGHQAFAYRLVALFWIDRYRRLSASAVPVFLGQWLDDTRGVDLWGFISAFPSFMSEADLPASFAASWFLQIGNKVKNDGASGGFWEGVGNYAFSFPQSGLNVLKTYIEQGHDDLKISLSAILLGSLRINPNVDTKLKAEISELEQELLLNPKTELRLCCYRSWATSFLRGAVSLEQLKSAVDKALAGTLEEKDEAFDIVRRCFFKDLKSESYANFAVQWYKGHAKADISSRAKLGVVQALHFACNRRDVDDRKVAIDDANEILISLQPVDENHNGIWGEIEHYLVDRLHEDKVLFAHVFRQLVATSPKIVNIMFKNREFEYLKSELSRVGAADLITTLCFSEKATERQLGNKLFQNIPITAFLDTIAKGADEQRLRLVLWEFMRRPFDGPNTSRFLLMLEPLFRNVAKEIKDEFENELVMQAINYPGGCLDDSWKKLGQPPEMIQTAIKKADAYFETHRESFDSPANSFVFPEFFSAAEKGAREFSRQVSEGVEERSFLASLFKHTDLIYGDTWSMVGQSPGGGPSDPQPLHHISHTIEMPRLEGIDPEGMALRRLGISRYIHERDNNNEQEIC